MMIKKYHETLRRAIRPRAMAFGAVATLVLAAGFEAAAEPAPWKGVKTATLQGLRVTLSSPVLVARDKGYLWFPTLSRLSDGRLLALMSNYADIHTSSSTCLAAWSADGGQTWTKPSPGLYGDAQLTLPSGDLLLLPYYMYPQSAGRMGAPYQICRKGAAELTTVKDGLSVSAWPRPDRSFAPELGLSGFVFNGQTVELKDGGYLATLYGYFKDTKRYSLAAAQSDDGVQWKIRSVVSDENCPLTGGEGPCEAALCRLADGRLLCVYRLASNVPFGQSFSSDEGRTWTEPASMPGVYSVQPSLAVLQNGLLALSGGRPGIFVWFNADGKAKEWQAIDLLAHHNACHPQEPISTKVTQTSSYTEVVALDPTHALCIYDRVPNGWNAIPSESQDTNSVWVVWMEVEF